MAAASKRAKSDPVGTVGHAVATDLARPDDTRIRGAVVYCKALDQRSPWPAGELARVAELFDSIAELAWPMACAEAVTNLVDGNASKLRPSHAAFSDALLRMRTHPVAAFMAQLYGPSLLTGDPPEGAAFEDAVALGRAAAEVAAIVRQRATEEGASRGGGRDRRQRLNGGAPEKSGLGALSEWQRASGASPTAVAKAYLGKDATTAEIKRFAASRKSMARRRTAKKVTKPRR